MEFGLDSGVPKKAPSMRVSIPPEMLQSHVESYSNMAQKFFTTQLANSDSPQGHCGVRLAIDIKIDVFGYAGHPCRRCSSTIVRQAVFGITKQQFLLQTQM